MSAKSSSKLTAQTFSSEDGDGYLLPAHSKERPTLSIVLPTLNEEGGITECIDRIKKALVEMETTAEIIVSDSSTDRTPEIARELGAIVVEPDEPGYGYAYRFAFERARGEYLVMGDADTTYDFEELPKLYERLQANGADIVIGSRLEGEIKPGAMPPLHQYVGNPLLTRFLNTFYDAGVTDAHSGFRVFTRGALERLDLRTNGMEFASEMIMDAGAKELVIEEVPVTYHEREGEATLDSFRDGWRHVKFMLVNAPGNLFTVPSLVFLTMGMLLMGASLLKRPAVGIYLGVHTMLAGSLFTIIGYQVGSLAVFSSIAGEPIKTPDDPFIRLVRDHFRLEHGASVGALLFVVGALFAGFQTATWATSGYTDTPAIIVSLIGFTGIVLGVQTVFYSFFLSILGEAQE